MDNKKRTRNLLLYLAIPIVLIIVAAIFLSTRQSDSPKTSELVQYFIDDKVESYTINYGSGAIEITLKEGEKPYPKTDSSAANSPLDILANSAAGTTDASGKSKTVIKGQLADIRLFIEEINAKSSPDEPVKYNYIRASDNSFLFELIPTIIMVAIFIGAWIFLMKRMGGGGIGREMNFGKAKIKNTNDEKRKTTFDDVAGADEEKEELAEVVEFLKNPDKFNKLGARIPKGVLLVGPPGTGKTLLARAVAGEAGVPFFSISGSDFVEMFVGVGASRVRDLFDQAKKNAPCIIFIDEIDAVGRQRGAGLGGGNDERPTVPTSSTPHCSVRADLTVRSSSAIPTSTAERRSSRFTPERSRSLPTSSCARSQRPPRALRARIWRTCSTRRRSSRREPTRKRSP